MRVVGKVYNEEWLCVLGWNEVSSHQNWGEILEQCGWRGDERVG